MNLTNHKSIFERGAWYVVAQAILIGLIFFGPRGPSLLTSQYLSGWFEICGILAGIAAFLILLISALNLGKNLTPLPCPKDHAQLVQTGLYCFVRHPMYFGVIMAAVAWLLLFPFVFILAYVGALFIFFNVKANREEVWLVQRFPAYSAYQVSVKKLIPGLY